MPSIYPHLYRTPSCSSLRGNSRGSRALNEKVCGVCECATPGNRERNGGPLTGPVPRLCLKLALSSHLKLFTKFPHTEQVFQMLGRSAVIFSFTACGFGTCERFLLFAKLLFSWSPSSDFTHFPNRSAPTNQVHNFKSPPGSAGSSELNSSKQPSYSHIHTFLTAF